MNERASLLALLIDEPTIRILKKRLTPEQRADLVLEIINPHRPLATEQKAALAGVTESAMRKRRARKT
jgi:phenylpyruvate tautomerase PptA (4-oxalocrotonate tautomerase family)